MPLLEYLRRASRDGGIHQRFKRRHKAEKSDIPLQEWINSIKTRGEIMVSAIMYTRSSDHFYGQWLLLNHPFRTVEELWHPRVDLVPASYHMLASCLLKHASYWTNMKSVEEDLDKEGFYVLQCY
jgi:hypothetical protein